MTTTAPETAYPGVDRVDARTRASCREPHVLICPMKMRRTCTKYKSDTNLLLLNIVSDMGLVFRLWTICPPTRHEFDIFNTPFLPFELEITIDGEEQRIKESVLRMMINERRRKAERNVQ